MVGYTIEGGYRLQGETVVQGAKNSVLPILASTLLVHNKTLLHRCQPMGDVQTARSILVRLGCVCVGDDDTLIVDATDASGYRIDDTLMGKMRCSIVFLAPLLARFGKAEIGLPGGCALGSRPIDYHLNGLERFGVQVICEKDRYTCLAPNGLQGTVVTLPFPSVGATETLLLAAVTARGHSVIKGCAREPEIVDLADFLNHCGARIRGAGTDTISVEGVKRLNACEYSIIPDRMAVVTCLSAACMTGGSVALKRVIPSHVAGELALFSDMGCSVRVKEQEIFLRAPAVLRPARDVTTGAFPAFPTDSGPLMVPVFCRANGHTRLTETVFEGRFAYLEPLTRFGCRVLRTDQTIDCDWSAFRPADAACTDLRGGAALLLAALCAEGQSNLTDVCHLERGYYRLPSVLNDMGAHIKEVDDYDKEEYQTSP